MKEQNLIKSYNKCKEIRQKIRQNIFQFNRNQSVLSYLPLYNDKCQQQILESLYSTLPKSLPPYCQASTPTISYYRRSNRFVYKTRAIPGASLDPHMTFESLRSLSQVEVLSNIPMYKQIVEQFQRDLPFYLNLSFRQIIQAASIAAGNHIIGKQNQILRITQMDSNNLWILTNHINYGRISHKHLFPYMKKNQILAYRNVFQLLNMGRQGISREIGSDKQLMELLVSNFISQDAEIQKHSILIVGSLLDDDFQIARCFGKFGLLQKVFYLLGIQSQRMRQDVCWMLGNYVSQQDAANKLLNSPHILQKLFLILRNQSNLKIKTQIYYILSSITKIGDKPLSYKMLIQHNIIQQCRIDMQLEDQNLIYILLNLIDTILQLAQQHRQLTSQTMQIQAYTKTEKEQTYNIFSKYIRQSSLKVSITGKTFIKNQEICRKGNEILQKINQYQ